jgi:hypothetical protein
MKSGNMLLGKCWFTSNTHRFHLNSKMPIQNSCIYLAINCMCFGWVGLIVKNMCSLCRGHGVEYEGGWGMYTSTY